MTDLQILDRLNRIQKIKRNKFIQVLIDDIEADLKQMGNDLIPEFKFICKTCTEPKCLGDYSHYQDPQEVII